MKKRSKDLVQASLVGAGIATFLVAVPVAMGAQPSIPAGAGITSWVENGSGGKYTLRIQEGTLPAAGQSVAATILSDSDCAPDKEGINHCRNEIELSDGSRLTGIDNHRMSVNRCLRSGEKVTISMLTDGWATVLTEDAKKAD